MENFKYLNKQSDVFDAEEFSDVQASKTQLKAQLSFYQKQLNSLSSASQTKDRIDCLLRIARIQIELHQAKDAWDRAFEAFSLAEKNSLWEQAVEACDALFLTEGPDALVALGHGLWLGVTVPIEAELSVAMLQHLITESPDESDTKAVAATIAHYIAETRTAKDSDLSLFTSQLLANVADNHSRISDQGSFDVWRKSLQLDNPDVFLPKLSLAIDKLIDDRWWFSKDEIYARLDETQNQN